MEEKDQVTSWKKTGKYLIDRISEKAIYNKLAENAKAHQRRHGVEGTKYIDEESQRVQSREMRRRLIKH